MGVRRSHLKEVLRHLSNGEWHSLYSIHERFRLPPDVIKNCIADFKKEGAVEIEGNKIRLSREISDDFMSNAIYIYTNSDLEINDDEKFRPHKEIEINELYCPRNDLLGKELRVDEE